MVTLSFGRPGSLQAGGRLPRNGGLLRRDPLRNGGRRSGGGRRDPCWHPGMAPLGGARAAAKKGRPEAGTGAQRCPHEDEVEELWGGFSASAEAEREDPWADVTPEARHPQRGGASL